MRKLHPVPLILLLLALLMVGCGGGGGGSTSVVVKVLAVNPLTAVVYYGGEVYLTVTGGTSPYTWSSSDLTLGRVDWTRTAPDGSSTYFVANENENQSPLEAPTVTVRVVDADGRAAQATITLSGRSLWVTPSAATIALDSETSSITRFFVSGGEPPYFWDPEQPYLADVYITGDGSQATVMAQQAGLLTLTVRDSLNAEATATVLILEEAPSIAPSTLALARSSSYTFRVFDGTPFQDGTTTPYMVYVSDPNILQLGDVLEDRPEDGSILVPVTGLNVGQADFIAEDRVGRKAWAHITVTDLPEGTITISPSAAVIEPGDLVTLTALAGLSPFTWTNENPELGDLIPTGTSNEQAVFYAGDDPGVARILAEDSRQVQAAVVVTIGYALEVLPSSVTVMAPEGATSTGTTLEFFIRGGVSPYTIVVPDTRYADSPATNPTTQDSFEITIKATAPVGTGTGVIEVYDAGGVKATVDVVIQAAAADG